MIDLNALPKEVRDIIELKEATDMTFSRFCIEENQLLFVNGELKKIKDIKLNDNVIGKDGSDRKVIGLNFSKQKCLEIKTDSGDVIVSTEHKMVLVDGSIVLAKNVCIGNGLLSLKCDCGVVVKSVRKVGIKKCVDIAVDGDRLFALGNGIITHNCDEDYTEILWNILAERANPALEHSFIASCYGVQGSGKSMLAIAMCCFLDPTFNIDRIFFNYNDLIYNRHKLKPNTAVLVDEQSQSYGLDSHRVMIILANLKEQLRKRSIHFFFCSPVLYEESKSSMYIIETMFIDYEAQECYAALKTREGLTLGHIRVPYPLKILEDGHSLASKELIDAYQLKKDIHLDKVLGQGNTDVFEERAEQVMKNALFLRAEKIYKFKMGYIPQNTVVQIINKIYPEYQAGVVPLEIAGRIKLNKELSGEWEVSGQASKRDRKTAVPQKKSNKPMRL